MKLKRLIVLLFSIAVLIVPSFVNAEVNVSSDKPSIKVNETAHVTATGPEGYTLTWSSNEHAEVSSDGTVTGKSKGTAVITATYKKEGEEDQTNTVSIEITEDTPELTISLDKEEITLEEGKTYNLKVTVSVEGKSVTWTSGKESVATVDDNGKVTAVKEGEATITAKVDDKTATCKVKVTKKAEEKPKSATLKKVTIQGATVDKIDDNNYSVTVTDKNKFSIVDDGKHVVVTLSDDKAKYSMTSLDAKNEFKILVGDNTYTFKVKKEEANTYLASLKITGYAFNQTFDKNTLSYTVTVPYDVTEVTITATAEDSNAKISPGMPYTRDELEVGGNTITIKVTNGSDSRTYKVFVTREEEHETEAGKKPTSLITKQTSNGGFDIPETEDPDSPLKIGIITLGSAILFLIGGFGIYFYFRTSPKRMKKELLKQKKKKKANPIVEIKNDSEDLEKTKEFKNL